MGQPIGEFPIGGRGLTLAKPGMLQDGGRPRSGYARRDSGVRIRIKGGPIAYAPFHQDPEGVPSSAKVILVVEDEGVVLRILTKLLEIDGHRVLAARNLEEAMLIDESYAGDLPLLFVDVVLKEADGPEVVRRIRQRRPSIQVVYMSGYPEVEFMHRDDIQPGDRLLRKPIGFEALREILK